MPKILQYFPNSWEMFLPKRSWKWLFQVLDVPKVGIKNLEEHNSFRTGSKGINLFLPQKTKLGAKKLLLLFIEKSISKKADACFSQNSLLKKDLFFFFLRNLLLEAAYIFLLLPLLPALNDDSDVCCC